MFVSMSRIPGVRVYSYILKSDVRENWLHIFLWHDFNGLFVSSSPRLLILKNQMVVFSLTAITNFSTDISL